MANMTDDLQLRWWHYALAVLFFAVAAYVTWQWRP
jgi:hypothetical protein